MLPSWTALAAYVPSVTTKEMHFIVRHWHTADDGSGSSFQGDSLEQSYNRYFVVVEGYIVPPAESGTGRYEFYLVCQADTTIDGVDYAAGDRVMIHKTGDESYVTKSAYVAELDHGKGIITLSANQLTEGDTDDAPDLETFSTYSISSGHDAVTIVGDDLVIEYKESVHLVKAHAFYVKTTMEVNGTDDEIVLGNSGITDNPEKDTDGTGEDKIYATTAGLHTDKTAKAVVDESSYKDGKLKKDERGEIATRTFDITLEAWHSEGYSSQVGMVLDASGSMAFASDKPDPIRVTDVLTAQEIADLGIQPVTQSVTTSGWDAYFLSDKQMGYLLNPHNTDNSLLSSSGYSYFVRNDDGDYAPLGYWEGSLGSSSTFAPNTDADVVTGWPDDHRDLNFSTGNGLSIYTSSTDSSTTGILLTDAKPTSDTFTISFMIKNNNSAPAQDANAIAPILYIGPMSVNTSNGDFFNVYRDSGSSSARLKGNQQTYRGDDIANLNSVFDANNYRITLVFENVSSAGGTVTAYRSDAGGSGTGTDTNTNYSQKTLNTPISDFNIIINGLQSGYSGGVFYIDDIYVIGRALTSDEVGQLHQPTPSYSGGGLLGQYMFNKDPEIPTGDTKARDWMKNGVTGNYAQKLTNAVEIKIPGIAKTSEGKILGSINRATGNATAAIDLHHTAAGWYFISHAGAYDNHYIYPDLLTGKRVLGVNGSQGVTGTDSAVDENGAVKGTGAVYAPTTDVPVRFYVDQEGYLRCFFYGGNATLICSYVYELGDSEYIRTEALQRALGLFVTELKESNPDSRVSATMFHSADVSNQELYRLVLLNWTDQPSESAAIMSLARGDGSSTGSTASKGVESVMLNQYNYGLTGSTSTWRGLQAYTTYLKPYDNPYEKVPAEEVPRFLIIFTDGKDTDYFSTSPDGNQYKAIELARALKNDNYTIFSVLLDGGTMGASGLADAKAYLTQLSGTKAGNDGDDHFFSVAESRATLGSAADGLNDSDILTQIFVKEILNKIVQPLTDYAVQDYIDPRFDLVDGDGNIWHLNAGGQVVIVSASADEEDGETDDSESEEDAGESTSDVVLDLTDGSSYNNDPDEDYDDPADFIPGVRITINSDSDDVAMKPYLRYSDQKGLYYLEWLNQTIPGCSVGAKSLAVWDATFRIRAKEDFIGGNAVLSNGNDELMNYVYSTGDRNPSSGTDHSTALDYPNGPLSKGFPRTSVNVSMASEDLALEQTIYMGESLDKTKIAQIIIDAAKKEANETDARYCWEYVGRFVEYFNYLHAIGDPDGIIERLHTMNRDGELIDKGEEDSLEDKRIKIISNRIYKLITGTDEEGKTLSIETLSELLLSTNSEINDKDGIAPRDQYLYIPYIYLPDHPTAPNNSTGNGEYKWDVLGYLYFHIDEQHTVDGKTYPAYPDTENGVTEDTDTRMSQLTVSFLARSSKDRKEWNNSQAIQEKKRDENGNVVKDKDGKDVLIYGRDTVYKPAAGAEIDDTIITGTFTTHIVSGEVQLQVCVDPDLVKAGGSFKYAANLVRTYQDEFTNVVEEIVGTLTVQSSSIAAGQTYTATFTPAQGYEYMGYGTNNQYALPIGTYKLANIRRSASAGYEFSEEPELQILKVTDNITFKRGTDHKDANKYPAPAPYSDSEVMLGTFINEDEEGNPDPVYTDERFALFRVYLTRSEIVVPKTGDRNHPVLWLAMALAGIAGLILMRRHKRGARF